jgi:hydrogenase/urease accessory protein HupE
MRVVALAFLLLLTFALAPARPAGAHPMQVEPVIIQLRPQEKFLNAEFTGNVQDIEQIPGYTQQFLDDTTMQTKGRAGEGYNAEFTDAVQRYLNDRFVLTRGGETLTGKVIELRHEPGADITKAKFKAVLRYETSEAHKDQPLNINNTLFDYLPNAKVVVTVGSFSRPMEPGTTAEVDPKNLAANLLTNVWSFLVLGMEHIFTGPDHVLFILALLIVATSLKSLIKTLTGFTVAHSLTLVWVTLSGQGPPARIVDVLVACSIIYVGLENLFIRPATDPKDAKARTVDADAPASESADAPAPAKKGFALTDAHRFWVASGFGLIHGFAFAQNLRDAGLPEGAALGWSLFSFNLGVEVAQVLIAAVAFPLVALWRKDTERRQRTSGMKWETVVKIASLGVVVAGAYWLTQRLFGG